ncbi:VOC family protein [Mycolicibacterium moriokaense]|nr:VOC family protein [Mycolicibacterium moriokaense]
MTNDDYPSGAPCWVDTAQPEPHAAMRFYGPLLGWSFDDAVAMPDGVDGDYFAARHAGRLVAGVGQATSSSPATWRTHVRVDDIEQVITRAERYGGTRLTDPVDAQGGRVATITDSTGVPFCLWQPGMGSLSGAEVINEPNTWAMSSLHTADVVRAREFYGNVFGWQLDTMSTATFSRWRLSGRVVAVVTATDDTAVPQHWSVNFAVRDTDAITQHTTALGGHVVMPPTDTPGFRSAVVADPQGGFIAVSARRPSMR